MAALDLALARQEVLAAANSSNPLARAIILRLAASVGMMGSNGNDNSPVNLGELSSRRQ